MLPGRRVRLAARGLIDEPSLIREIETFEEEMEFLLKLLGVSYPLVWPRRGPYSLRATPSIGPNSVQGLRLRLFGVTKRTSFRTNCDFALARWNPVDL